MRVGGIGHALRGLASAFLAALAHLAGMPRRRAARAVGGSSPNHWLADVEALGCVGWRSSAAPDGPLEFAPPAPRPAAALELRSGEPARAPDPVCAAAAHPRVVRRIAPNAGDGPSAGRAHRAVSLRIRTSGSGRRPQSTRPWTPDRMDRGIAGSLWSATPREGLNTSEMEPSNRSRARHPRRRLRAKAVEPREGLRADVRPRGEAHGGPPAARPGPPAPGEPRPEPPGAQPAHAPRHGIPAKDRTPWVSGAPIASPTAPAPAMPAMPAQVVSGSPRFQEEPIRGLGASPPNNPECSTHRSRELASRPGRVSEARSFPSSDCQERTGAPARHGAGFPAPPQASRTAARAPGRAWDRCRRLGGAGTRIA